MNRYLRNSRNFFFISLFLLLGLQLVLLWSRPDKIEERIAENVSEKLGTYFQEISEIHEDKFYDSLSNDFSVLRKNSYWERFLEKTKGKEFTVLVYKNNKILYWSKSRIIPDCDYLKLKDGNNFRKLDNGWYVINQKSIGNIPTIS